MATQEEVIMVTNNMHLITEDPTKGKAKEPSHGHTYKVMPKKKVGLASALAGKITGKVSDALSAPARIKERISKQRSDRDLGIIKDHRAMKRGGTLDSEHGRKVHSAYQQIKSR